MMQIKTALQKRVKLISILVIITPLCFLYEYEYGFIFDTNTELLYQSNSDYLIYSSQCKVLDLDPWNPDAKKLYQKESYVSCSTNELLTKIVLSDNKTVARLVIIKKLVPKYTKEGVTCCTSDVNRGSGKNIDNKITYSKCRPIENYTITIPIDLPSMVTCRSKVHKKEIYKNVHVPIAITPSILEKKQKFKSNGRPLSVLIIGIDSISRLNMIRTMPKTRRLLSDNPLWNEFRVYNKIGDNTFPNLIAMLTGMDSSVAYKDCNPKVLGGLNKCDFMWNRFGDNNYVTAYAEDSAHMSTFNYKKKGFNAPPTDYYMRSYQLACDDLKAKLIDSAIYCTGPEMEGERVWRITKEFVNAYNDTPYFGFFWTNSYSHQQLNTPTRLDAKIHDFMLDIDKATANNTIVIFLSDHGLRFGKIRHSLTGYIEERLPFLYIKFPNWFQKQFPKEYGNILENRDKLVTPFDLYMTLQDVLKYSGFDYNMRPSAGCPKCHSLFEPVDMNRSCEEVNITQHWCTCLNYKEDKSKNELARRASKMVVAKLQQIIDERNATSLCAKYSIAKIIRTYRSQCLDNATVCDENFMVIIVEMKPSAIFEATLSLKQIRWGFLELPGKMEMYSGFSRLDSYSHSGKCTDDTYLKLLCYCK